MRVHVIVAHPDDELLGVGGTIMRHRAAGDRVHITIACTADLRDGNARLQAASRVAAELGASLEFGAYPQLGYRVPEFNVDADIVYTHHPGDLNRDHRLVAEAVRVACRPGTAAVRSLRYMDTASSTEWGEPFRPTLFVDVSATLVDKVELIAREYSAELRPYPHPRSARALYARAAYWGTVAGVMAAEPFVVERETW